MKIERTKNAKKNIISSLILKAVTIVSPFAIRLIIIYSLGAEYVGLSSLFSSIISVLNLAELGIGSAIVFSMYEPLAKDNYDKLGALLKFYRKVYLGIAVIVAIVGVAFIPFLPNFISGEYPANINIYLLYLIYFFNSLAGYLFGAYRTSLFTIHQREDIINRVTLYVQIPAYFLQIVVLLVLGNYYLYVLLISLAIVAINLVLAYKSKKQYPKIREEGSISKSDIRTIVKGVGGLLINKVSSTVRNSFDSIFLTMFAGLIVNALYSNYYYILISINSVLLIFGQSVKAGIGNSLVLNDEEKNYNEYMSLQFIYMFISGVAIICFASLCQPFVKIVFGKKLVMDIYPFTILVTYLFALKIVDINNIYIDASGIWWKNKWATIFDVAFNFIFDYILGKFFGLTGILVATVLTIYLFQFLMKSIVLFKEIFPNYSSFKYIVMQHVIGIIIIVVLFFSRVVTCGKNIVLQLFLAVLLYFIAYVFFFHKTTGFTNAKEMLKNVIKMKLK